MRERIFPRSNQFKGIFNLIESQNGVPKLFVQANMAIANQAWITNSPSGLKWSGWIFVATAFNL
jgi:hypothetical protein